MKRLAQGFGIAFLTFSAGVIITAIFWLNKLPPVIKLEAPSPFMYQLGRPFQGYQ